MSRLTRTIASSPEEHAALAALVEALSGLPSERDLPIVERRAWLEDLMRDQVARIPFEQDAIAGVPVERHLAAAGSNTAAVLYAHGGAYVMGSAATNRDLAHAIGRAAGAPVISADYRLAPEHPFPAGRDDLVAVYRALLQTCATVALVGDSAGAGLVISAACAIRDAGLAAPAALACLSPWSDLELTDARDTTTPADPLLDLATLREDARRYAGVASLHAASPRHADLRGLAPLLIQVGSAERLLQDARALADAVADAGGEVILEIWQPLIHGWHLFPRELPQAAAAIAAVGSFLRERLR